MAQQPAQSRPWFRLPSISRPAPEPAPTPVPEPRPLVAPPAFRPPVVQPAPTQEPIVAPAAPVTTAPPPVASPPPAVIQPASGGVASAPTSPVQRPPAPTAASLPNSPQITTASVPPSPRPRILAPTSSLPPSPPPKPAAITSSVQTSPATKPMTTSATRVPSPVPSPRTIKPEVQSPHLSPKLKPTAPPPSPKLKPTAPPPSPLNLPPTKIKSDSETEAKIPLEAEKKTVVVQKTIDKPKPWFSGGESEKNLLDSLKSSIGLLGKKQEPSKQGETKEKVHRKKTNSDSEKKGVKVITIAGENKGAFMEITHSPKKNLLVGSSINSLHNNPNPKGNEWKSYTSSSSSRGEEEEEGKRKMKDKSHKGRSMLPSPMSAFTNSNVQGVNNSIVYNTSCSHHDPGVHFALSRNPAGGGFIKDRGNAHHG